MRLQRIALLLLLVSAAPAADKPQLPQTSLGKRTSAMLAAFNSGQGGRILHFIEDNYAARALKERTANDRAATYLQLYEETGGLQLRHIEASTEGSLTFLAETHSTAEWYRITCQAEAADPYRLLGISFQLIPRPVAYAGKGPLGNTAIAEELNHYADKLSKAGLFGGVILYADGSQVVLERAYPWRKSERETIPYQTNGRFGLASINKMFVAVAVTQLAGQGKLAFSDPVARYLADYPQERAEKITIHQLLTHTAGIEPLLDPQAFDDMRNAGIRTRADQVRFLGRRPLIAAPGEGFHYSNAGYMLLEAIVESVSGHPFQEYARANLFAPLGMTSAGQDDATAADLLRFCRGLLEGKLVSPEMLRVMMTPHVRTNDPETGYGYGMEIRTINGTRIVGHAGGGPQVSAQHSGRVVIVLSRRPGNTAQRVANRARELLTQR